MSNTLHPVGGNQASDGSADGESVGFQTYVDAYIETFESFDSSFYWDSTAHHVAVGYGFDIFENTNFNTLLSEVGVNLTGTQISDLDQINSDIAANETASAYDAFTDDFTGKNALPTITQIQATDLVEIIRQTDINSTSFNYLTYGSLANTKELAVLEELFYNGGTSLVSINNHLVGDIEDGNRAGAWYEIRFDSNGNNSNGIAKARYLASSVFDIWGADLDPSGSGTPTFSLVSISQALQDVASVFQMYSAHEQTIIKYDQTYGAEVIAADTDYSTFEATYNIDAQTTNEAFEPAFLFLMDTFAEGINIPGPGSEGDAYGSLGIDRWNVYADPGTLNGANTASVVAVPTPDGGNYIVIGNGTGQTIQGVANVDNVLIAPAGGDVLDSGSEGDVVWGAPTNAIVGSLLDLSGTTPGSEDLYNGSVSLFSTIDSNGNPETEIISGTNTLQAFYVDGIYFGNTLSIVPGGSDGSPTFSTKSASLAISSINFENLGNGDTIFAGSGDTLNVVNNSLIIDGGTSTPTQQYALPTGLVVDPFTGTPLTSGTGALTIELANNKTIWGSLAGQVLIGVGSGDVLNAGASMNTLIELTGTTGNYGLNPNPNVGTYVSPPGIIDDGFDDHNNYNGGVTEIVQAGSTGDISSNNTLNAFFGDNILIGDSGNNTFSVSAGFDTTNIIYGGGGDSTYEVPVGGTIDIVYTAGTPTVEEIQNWASGIFKSDANSTASVTYIIDPTSSDEVADSFGPVSTGSSIAASVAGVYTPAEVPLTVGYYGPNTLQDQYVEGYSVQDGYQGEVLGGGSIQIGELVANGPTAFYYQMNPDFNLSIENFVNGDLGIDFSGDAERFPLLTDGLPCQTYGSTIVTPSSAYDDLAGDVDSYDEKQYIDIGGSGGTINDGSENATPGTSTTGVAVGSQGTLAVLAGAQVSGVEVGSGGIELVESQGTATGTTISSGGYLIVAGGGTVTASVLTGGMVVSRGVILAGYSGIRAYSGSTSATVSGDNSTEYILSSGISNDATIASGGTQIVFQGGSTSDNFINNSGTEIVYSGGTASSSEINSGGVVYISGGVAKFTYDYTSGLDAVLQGGVASSTVISSGGSEVVYSAGLTVSAKVYAGGQEIVSSGGDAIAAIVHSGGFEYVLGTASAAVVDNNGIEAIASGGSASSSTVSGGSVFISAGGQTIGDIVDSGGVETVLAGGFASATVINSGGKELVYSGGIVSGTTIQNGGKLILLPGYQASGIVNSGSEVTTGEIISRTSGISIDASFDRQTVSAGQIEFILSGGSSTDVTVDSGTQYVYAGASVIDNTVTSYGIENVDGGIASGTTVNSFGTQSIASGGVASSAVLVSLGYQQIYSGGTASGTTVLFGSEEIVSSGGKAINSVVSSGGYQNVFSGGLVSGSVISSGGLQDIFAGGVESGSKIEGGGSEAFEDGATIVGGISFAGGNATLSLDENTLPTNVISGFDASTSTDEISLVNFNYSSGADSVTLESGNTLRLDLDGTVTTLLFNPTQNFTGHSFELTSNDYSEVAIIDPVGSGNVLPKPSAWDVNSPWVRNVESSLTAPRMGFLNSGFSEESRSAEQESSTRGFWVTDLEPFLGRYADTATRFSGTTVPTSTVSAYQAGTCFGALANEPLQSGTQVSTYVHSGFA